MGAATALLYQAANPGSVNVMALDSGFSSLNDVIGSMAGNMGVPPEFVQMMFPMIE